MARTKNMVKEFLDKCKKVKNGKLTLEELINQLTIETYIPIDVKYVSADILKNIMESRFEDLQEDFSLMLRAYEISKFNFIFGRYINCDLSIDCYDSKIYDIFHEIGLVDYVMDKASRDFEDFSKIVDRIVGIDNYAMIGLMTSMLSQLPTEEKMDKFVNTVNSLDSDKIQILGELTKLNDPFVSKAAEALKNGQIENFINKELNINK